MEERRQWYIVQSRQDMPMIATSHTVVFVVLRVHVRAFIVCASGV